MGFDPELLSITIHPEDQEAYDVWHNEIGIPEERLIRLEGTSGILVKVHLVLTQKFL